MFFRKIPFIIICVCVLFLFACGPKAIAPKAKLDTPEHHVTNGTKLLKSGKIDAAFREFNRAKELDPKYSPAYVGLGLVSGYNGDFISGLENMKNAEKYARGNNQEIAANAGYMRLYIMGREKVEKNWLKKVKTRFNKSIAISPDLPEPYFYMGIAYKISCKFSDAASQFVKILELDNGYIKEADKEYALIQKIERAMPGSKAGKKIALVEKITRADVAALFIEELKINELFAKKTQKKFDTSYKSPEKKFATGVYTKVSPATDIEDHVLKADIDTVIAIGIKGLQPFPDHTYKPYKTITRAEYAMMMEDILIKITGVDELATRFIGIINVPVFPDMRNDLPFFNAVMVCTTRGIMTAKDVTTGEFDPKGPVSGAEALLSIRILKTQF